ncbi:Cobyrinic acid A,C-diamide synthase [Tepidanaerobacter acetatoxydans Re1]|uniref:Cobyrinate a,c-diamide synthase n=1 Tax=Tepidanaerobacter acetatoxydans (strain DSM 21804 / JCM 16047 / Re1) TaxID=1209989 RepID=F4LUT0_TEPAE|nr:cobyrinate a,c-diamide synthase [Tepidanaerobacter acetatoxydans]AEE90648.1 Cobyrinic acid A,C-diamide synthase [Tepidanaerobacter acetatoxydans Re1]CCP25178.1 Cobyrinic acid A,C-diamide synthase [Tepidanaerobacter acetatoxydans Re1]
MNRGIMIAGTNSGSGKTTISLGIMGALSKRLKVVPFKVGPDYIDPAYHKLVSGSPSYNLDLHMLGEERLVKLFYEKTARGDISIVEGVMGLFDGKDSSGFASSAHVAKILGIPVILVADAGGMSRSASAMVKGYKDFDPELNLAGVIFNRVGGDSHFELLKECVEKDTGLCVLGYLPKDEKLVIPERPMGLMPPEEMKNLEAGLERLNYLVEKHIDLARIFTIAESAHIPALSNEYSKSADTGDKKPKIAVAMDDAFCFYYNASLELFEEKGAKLVPFSPLKDAELPEGISGLYIGGGFPENFGRQLSQNNSMKDSVFCAINAGLPTYAEGGGLMYLAKTVYDRCGKAYPMVGIFDCATVMTDRLQNFGYVTAEVVKDNVIASSGTIITGQEFHYSKINGNLNSASYIIRKPEQNRKWQCGYIYKNCLASYMHIDFYAYPKLLDNFLSKCRQMDDKE